MKREFITGLWPEIPKETLDKIMDENGRDVEAVKAKYADYDTLKTQLSEADKTIEGFKAMDIEGIKKAAEDWKTKATKAEQDAATKIADLEFSTLLDGAITSSKGRNAKAVRALLDVETLKASKNQEADIKAALEAMQKENGYLFDTEAAPPPYAGGTGAQNIRTPYSPEVAAIRSAAGLKNE